MNIKKKKKIIQRSHKQSFSGCIGSIKSSWIDVYHGQSLHFQGSTVYCYLKTIFIESALVILQVKLSVRYYCPRGIQFFTLAFLADRRILWSLTKCFWKLGLHKRYFAHLEQWNWGWFMSMTASLFLSGLGKTHLWTCLKWIKQAI